LRMLVMNTVRPNSDAVYTARSAAVTITAVRIQR
jgi:hypothetical protein